MLTMKHDTFETWNGRKLAHKGSFTACVKVARRNGGVVYPAGQRGLTWGYQPKGRK